MIKHRSLQGEAGILFARALAAGLVKRSTRCEDCGGAAAHAHHKDYAKPLRVEWLCHKCHGKRHAGSSPRERHRTNLGNVLHGWRIHEGLTLSQAAKILGIRPCYMYSIEKEYFPNGNVLAQLLNWLTTKTKDLQ